MKKILMMAAFAAAGAAFTACSSDESLAEVPEVIEEPTATPEDEGTPLVVKLVDGNGTTRGTEWKATTLPSFTLYSVKNGGTDRWDDLCSYSDAGVSTGSVFENTPDTENEGAYTGEFKNANGSIKWKDGNWDFYALSDAKFASEDNGNGGTQDAEHLNAASDRNFTYTVSNDYAAQKDLLVAAATNQTATTNSGNVVLPFYHALARIKSVKLKYKAPLDEGEKVDNRMEIFIIKDMTLKNVPSTATFTFPNPDADPIDKNNINDCWGTATGVKDYKFTFPDFERVGDANYIKVFEEEVDTDDPYETEPTGYAMTTRYSDAETSTTLPNYLRFGADDYTYEFPLTKSDGTIDDGLYVIPQTLAKTQLYIGNDGSGNVYYFNTDAESNPYTTPYLEVRLLHLQDPYFDSSAPNKVNDATQIGFSHGTTDKASGNWNNANITKVDDDDSYATVCIPLSSITLDANKYYSLVFYFNMAIVPDDHLLLFDNATLE